jgi:hypothetical protein
LATTEPRKKRSTKLKKFINYTREAFFWPFHLALLGIFTLLTVVGMVAIGELGLAMNPVALLFAFGGLELITLNAITKNDRFIRAINAKYSKDIDAYYKTKTLVDYYNSLSLDSQQRFDSLRNTLKEVKDNFTKLQSTMPELVRRFLERLNSIETSYARLLYFKDKFPQLTNEEIVQETTMEMDKLNQEMKTASGRLKQIKEKRMKLLQMRIDNFFKVRENREVIEEQLQTIEEMVAYIKDQPMTMSNTEREDIMIDNLLFETEQTQESLNEIESLMQSEFYPGMLDEMDSDSFGGNVERRIKE